MNGTFWGLLAAAIFISFSTEKRKKELEKKRRQNELEKKLNVKIEFNPKEEKAEIKNPEKEIKNKKKKKND